QSDRRRRLRRPRRGSPPLAPGQSRARRLGVAARRGRPRCRRAGLARAAPAAGLERADARCPEAVAARPALQRALRHGRSAVRPRRDVLLRVLPPPAGGRPPRPCGLRRPPDRPGPVPDRAQPRRAPGRSRSARRDTLARAERGDPRRLVPRNRAGGPARRHAPPAPSRAALRGVLGGGPRALAAAVGERGVTMSLADAYSPYVGLVTAVDELLPSPDDARQFHVVAAPTKAAAPGSGYGAHRERARTAALGEALERYSASIVPAEDLVRARARDLPEA